MDLGLFSYVSVLLNSMGLGHRAFHAGDDDHHCGDSGSARLRTPEVLDRLWRSLGLWSDGQRVGAFGSASSGALGDMALAAAVTAGRETVNSTVPYLPALTHPLSAL